METTHSIIIITDVGVASVWYPNDPRYVHHHFTTSEGNLEPEAHNTADYGRPIGAKEFIELWATGTEN